MSEKRDRILNLEHSVKEIQNIIGIKGSLSYAKLSKEVIMLRKQNKSLKKKLSFIKQTLNGWTEMRMAINKEMQR